MDVEVGVIVSRRSNRDRSIIKSLRIQAQGTCADRSVGGFGNAEERRSRQLREAIHPNNVRRDSVGDVGSGLGRIGTDTSRAWAAA